MHYDLAVINHVHRRIALPDRYAVISIALRPVYSRRRSGSSSLAMTSRPAVGYQDQQFRFMGYSSQHLQFPLHTG
ncbi:MAG: hypothetical protein ACLVJO_06075 [[Clostridium] scindens]